MPGSIYFEKNKEDLEPLNEPLSGSDRNSEVSNKEKKHETTDFQTLLHILKGNVGPGILALPMAIAHGGWLFGSLALLVVAAMAIHCMQLLVDSSRHCCLLRNRDSMDYGQVAETTLSEFGPSFIRNRSKLGRKIVNLFVIIAQFGFCCSYFIFIASNIQQFIHDNGSAWFVEFTEMQISQTVITICMAFPICMICSIRNLDSLSIWSFIANFAALFSLSVIYYYLGTRMLALRITPREEPLPMIQDLGNIAIFFGAAMFAFEGITVVLPLENSMKNKTHFPNVLKLGMSIITLLFFLMGLCGYLGVGENVKPSITLNLPNTGSLAFLYSFVKLSYSFVVFISFALQFYVPISFMWPSMADSCFGKYKGKRTIIYLELVFRYSIVWILCLLSVFVPFLDDFIGLVGAFACSALSLIFPPMMDELLHSTTRRPLYYKIKNYTISFIGVVGMFLGTYNVMLSLIGHFSEANLEYNSGNYTQH